MMGPSGVQVSPPQVEEQQTISCVSGLGAVPAPWSAALAEAVLGQRPKPPMAEVGARPSSTPKNGRELTRFWTWRSARGGAPGCTADCQAGYAHGCARPIGTGANRRRVDGGSRGGSGGGSSRSSGSCSWRSSNDSRSSRLRPRRRSRLCPWPCLRLRPWRRPWR